MKYVAVLALILTHPGLLELKNASIYHLNWWKTASPLPFNYDNDSKERTHQNLKFLKFFQER